MYNILEALYVVSEVSSSLIIPAIALAAAYIGYRILKDGKFGALDLSGALSREYKVFADENSTVNITTGVPLDSEGNVDQKEVAKRTWALVQQYHAQGLRQSQVSFFFSIGAAIFGFLVIMYGVFSVFGSTRIILEAQMPGGIADKPSETVTTQAILSIVSGIVIDAVAALFFMQSNKARLLMSEFFDRLRVDRKLEEALTLISNIKDDQISARTQALLAINLAEINLEDSIFDRILTGSFSQGDEKP